MGWYGSQGVSDGMNLLEGNSVKWRFQMNMYNNAVAYVLPIHSSKTTL
jgi:hypothetical protein